MQIINYLHLRELVAERHKQLIKNIMVSSVNGIRIFVNRHNAKKNTQSGQGLTEYIIIVIVVAVVLLVALRYFGGSLNTKFQTATQGINNLKEESSQQEPILPATETVTVINKQETKQNLEVPLKEDQSSAVDQAALSELDKKVSELHPTVGENEELKLPTIKIDYSLLYLLLAIVFLLGIVVILLRKKSKKKKKNIGSLFSKNENGQVLVLGLFVCVGLFMIAISVANIGMMVSEKIHLQDSVDAAAYSAAVTEARYMNLSAYINRAMIANYDAMAFNTALWASVDAYDHGSAAMLDLLYKIDAVLAIPVVTLPLAEGMDHVLDAVRKFVHGPLHTLNKELNKVFAQDDDSTDINGLIESYNADILSTYQGLLYAAIQSSRHEVIEKVAKKMDPQIETSSVIGLAAEAINYEELAKAVDFIIADPEERDQPFSSFNKAFNKMAGEEEDDSDHPLLFAATTEASLNRFTAGKTRDGERDILRNFRFSDVIPFDPIESVLNAACEVQEFARKHSPARFFTDPLRCEADLNLGLNSQMRDGNEDLASDCGFFHGEDQCQKDHVPVIARRRMREVNFFGWSFKICCVDGVVANAAEALIDNFEGDWGHTSAEVSNDLANVENLYGFNERALESAKYYEYDSCLTSIPPTCALNGPNLQAALTMVPPVLFDDHWDGTLDVEPVHTAEIFPPFGGVADAGEYGINVNFTGDEKEEGVPKYDYKVDLPNVGFPHYIYSDSGASVRPAGTSGGSKNNKLSGPSVVVVGSKLPQKIKGMQGLGIGNPYPMSAIARAQVYYLRNPKREEETPSLFNPHWVARLAPIDSEDSPEMLKEGLPFIASFGIGIKPTH